MPALNVKDESALAELLAIDFERDGFNVSSTAYGLRDLDLEREVDTDVAVLDLGLPDQRRSSAWFVTDGAGVTS